MELSLQSALSPAGMLGHSAYLFLVLSMAMQRMVWLRLFVLASSAAGIAYSGYILHDPVGTFWESLLIAVNVSHMAFLGLRDRRTRFEAEELRFCEAALPGLRPALRRKVLAGGQWSTAEPGEMLARQGEETRRLCWLLDGEAVIDSDGMEIARCSGGVFVGELTVLTGGKASATVTLTAPARLWAIEAGTLRRLMKRHAAIAASVEQGFARDLRGKLRAANRKVAAMSALVQLKPSARHQAGQSAPPASCGRQKLLPATLS